MVKHLTIEEARKDTDSRHVLGLSGGKDSAALAIHLKDNYPDLHDKVEYFFSDTGAELPEVYEYLKKLEAYLGKEIKMIGSGRDFEHWLKVHNDYLPGPRQRWCTVTMKLKPFEEFIGTDNCISYVGIRADEPRDGYVSTKENIKAVFPFKDDDLIRDDIFRILEQSVGVPEYYAWRSRSGCYFCFFQRRDEWLGLKRNHPQLFEKAKEIERKSGAGYTWVQGMTLDEVVEKAEQKEKDAGIIHRGHTTDKEKWQNILRNAEDDDMDDQACVICSL